MLNGWTKAKPWVAASLLVAASAWGQESDSCAPKPQKSCARTCPTALKSPTVAAYDAPSRTNTRCSWDLWLDASFIYWQPIQDNMEFAVTQHSSANDAKATGIQGHAIQQDFEYKPGFKIGGGWVAPKHDNWDFASEYTWLRSEVHKDAHNHSTDSGTGLYPLVGAATDGTVNTLNTITQVYNTADSTWHLGMDLVDANMGRWHYVGTSFTLRPYIGARGAWIRQSRKAVFVNDGSTGVTSGSPGTYTVRDGSHSWGVGPEIGFSSQWRVYEGFRFEGDAQADVLYTRYTKIYHTAKGSATFNNPYDQNTHEPKMGTLRTHLDLELGIAWGSYFDNNNWHIDFAAMYGFQVFFNQNVFRTLNNSAASRPSLANLYVQGLTITTRMDF